MTEEEIREIIRNELQEFLASDRYIFTKTIQILDGRNIIVGKTTGTEIGTETTQKIGFYGYTPVDQPARVDEPSDASVGYVQAEQQSQTTAIKGLIALLKELGLMAP